MASLKEIRVKVASIKSTQKITKAMQLVAASKMRKAQERMAAGKPYAQKIRQVVAHVAHATPEYKHAYLVERPVKRVGYIVVSSDRGLCGGLNINLFKQVVSSVRDYREQGVEAGDMRRPGHRAVGGHITHLDDLGVAVVHHRHAAPEWVACPHLGKVPQGLDHVASIEMMSNFGCTWAGPQVS